MHQNCISTAMVFFHKFFIFKKGFIDDFEKYLTCASCILLAVKVCNQLTPLEELVKFFLKQYNRQKSLNIAITDELVFDTCEKVCQREFEILNSIGFDLNVDLPYKYVLSMKSYYFDYLKNHKLMIITNNFINDSFKLPLCLYFDPLLVALASLYLVSIYFKLSLPDTKEGIKWFKILDNNIELKEIISLSEMINNIYKFCNESKVSFKKSTGCEFIKFNPKSILGENFYRIESNLDVKGSLNGVESVVDYLTFP